MPMETRFARRQGSSAADENGRISCKNVLGTNKLLPAKRRALCDVGNDATFVGVAAQGNRGNKVGRACLADAPRQQQLAQQQQAPLAPQRPFTRAQARAAPAQPPASLSMLLQARSEQAARPGRAAAATASAAALPNIDTDTANPQAACDYVQDIYSYYRRIEPRFQVSPDYIGTQRDINTRMRSILVDWLVDVHLKFKLMPETLFLATSLVDRYLEAKQVGRCQLQLVGVAGMMIAAKYEEIWAPMVRDFVMITDKTYSKAEILAMERDMLTTLQYNVSTPTSYQFMARYLKAAGVHMHRHTTLLVAYVAELCLVDISMLRYRPSLLAAAALQVALESLGYGDTYPRALARHAGYSRQALLPCAQDIVRLMLGARGDSLRAVHAKYSSEQFGGVAALKLPMHLLDCAQQ